MIACGAADRRRDIAPASRFRAFYQSSFNPNWTWRDVVDVLVIEPAVPERPVRFAAVGGVKTMRFGVLKLARFKRLKISARNWTLSRSRTRVSLRTEKSHVASPGPVYVFLPALPKNPLVEGGAIKAAGLNHWEGFPVTTLPVKS